MPEAHSPDLTGSRPAISLSPDVRDGPWTLGGMIRRLAVPALVGLLALGVAPAQAAVTATVTDGVLSVASDAGDAIAIACSAGNVKVNGADPGPAPVACASIVGIGVSGGPGANVIDLSAVTRAAFSGLPDKAEDDPVGPVSIDGAGGDDVITGSEADDELLGFDGDDVLDGGPGHDTLFGEDGGDTGRGGDGDDILIDRRGPGLLEGGAGDDSITGGLGSDTLRGGPGHDELQGGEATDHLEGGDGDDRLSGDPDGVSGFAEPFNDAGDDTLDGGPGEDTIAATDRGPLRLTATQLTGPGTDTFTSIERAELTGTGGADVVDASAFPGPAALYGGLGPDVLVGGPGADTLDGQGGDDVLTGGEGDDAFTDRQGTDRLVEAGDLDFTVTATALTGRGTDSLDSIEVVELSGGPGANLIDAGGFGGATVLTGAGGNDSLTGGSGPDRLIGGDGDDSLAGGAGEDVVVETTEGDLILTPTALAGRGSDTLSGIERAELTGGAGPNRLDAAAFTGAVRLAGGDGDDTLVGGAAGDRLTGGPGADALAGGPGSDRLVEAADADLILSDATLAGAGGDALSSLEVAELTGGPGANRIDARAFSGAVTLAGGGGADTLLGGPRADVLAGGDGDDTLLSGDGDDTLLGGEGLDALDGGSGRDSLMGEFGDDSLLGGDGDDVLEGGAGNDRLAGGAGDDELAGGAGDDELAGVGGDDRLAGGENADRLDGGDGADELLGGDGDDDLLGGAGADYLGGEAGNDRLEGQAGLDIFSGDEGDDRLLPRDGLGEPLITCGAGHDTAVDPDPDDTVQPNCEVIERPQPPSTGERRPTLAIALSRKRFAPYRRGRSLRAKRPRGRRGARLTMRLSEPARVTFRVQRLARGRRHGKGCVAPRRADRGARRCTRRIRVRGRFRATAGEGRTRLTFTGRVAGKALRRGRYRLLGRAKTRSGDRSPRAVARFRIVR